MLTTLLLNTRTLPLGIAMTLIKSFYRQDIFSFIFDLSLFIFRAGVYSAPSQIKAIDSSFAVRSR